MVSLHLVFLITSLSLRSVICDNATTPHYFELDKAFQFEKKTLQLPPTAASLQSYFLTDKSSPWKSYSQSKQDCTINALFGDKSNGYFVDLAANDWRSLSNSLMLEYYNDWKGICIEPNPQYLEGLVSNRKCAIYVNPTSSTTGEVVKFSFKGVYGGIVGEEFDNKNGNTNGKGEVTELVTVKLEQILDHAKAPKVIDYFSLDVEGAEYHVLSHFDFSKYTFLSITVERPSIKVHHILIKNGYRLVSILTDFGDCLYVHHTMSNFVEYMNQHHRAASGWYGEQKEYMKHPKWTGAYIAVEKDHSEHHGRSNSTVAAAAAVVR